MSQTWEETVTFHIEIFGAINVQSMVGSDFGATFKIHELSEERWSKTPYPVR